MSPSFIIFTLTHQSLIHRSFINTKFLLINFIWTFTLHIHAHSDIIHNKQKEKSNPVSVDTWMNKQNVVYTWNYTHTHTHTHTHIFGLFRAAPMSYGGSQVRGSNWSYSCQPTPQPQQRQIQAESVTYTIAHSNAGSLTHWARTGVKPTASCFLVGFVSDAPRQELPWNYILFKL